MSEWRTKMTSDGRFAGSVNMCQYFTLKVVRFEEGETPYVANGVEVEMQDFSEIICKKSK